LIEIGRFWAGDDGGGDPDALADELAEFGAPDSIRAQLVERQRQQREFGVLPENWDACQLFQRLATQWRVGMAGPVGLDYNTAFGLMDRRGYDYPRQDELLDQLRLIERGALQAMQRKN